MRDLGDRNEDSVIDFQFLTVATDNTPTTLAGSPSAVVYKGNDTTESAAGLTLTVDFDSVTGLNHIQVDLSSDAFYATGEDYSVVIDAGTVDGTSVVGSVLATFSIENRRDQVAKATSELMPVTEVEPGSFFEGSEVDVSTFANMVALVWASLVEPGKPAPKISVIFLGSHDTSGSSWAELCRIHPVGSGVKALVMDGVQSSGATSIAVDADGVEVKQSRPLFVQHSGTITDSAFVRASTIAETSIGLMDSLPSAQQDDDLVFHPAEDHVVSLDADGISRVKVIVETEVPKGSNASDYSKIAVCSDLGYII